MRHAWTPKFQLSGPTVHSYTVTLHCQVNLLFIPYTVAIVGYPGMTPCVQIEYDCITGMCINMKRIQIYHCGQC